MRWIAGLCPWFVLAVILLSPRGVVAEILDVKVNGLSNSSLKENVKAHIGSKWVSGTSLSSQRKREKFRSDAEIRAAIALRPFGFYFPEIKSSLTHGKEDTWLLVLTIERGQAIVIRELDLRLEGEGSTEVSLRAWKSAWPLQPGKRLNQPLWDEQKLAVLDLAREQGYLSASFQASTIELDLTQNSADLKLILVTGPRAVMGAITYDQNTVKEVVLDSIPRFNKGDYYSTWLVDKLRTDLWKTGYFEDIEVIEEFHQQDNPQRVDFKVTLKERQKNTHQGTVGYGTDSQFRMQYRWQRHLLSRRGDSLGLGLGWQQKNEELLLFGEYRVPRKTRSNQYWLLGAALKTEAQDFNIDSEVSDDDRTLIEGRVEDFSLRFGKVKLRDVKWSQEQIIETMFVQYLIENHDFSEDLVVVPEPYVELQQLFRNDDAFNDTNHSITLGMEWDWPVILGRKFATTGHHERAWVFTANDLWGSQREFTQIYLASRWNFVFSDRWKLLVRGELGYSDANVTLIEEDTGDDVYSVSVTELPFLYRFKAGGSRSVRGYGFEDLSTNNIGSNHIVTASVELEYQFMEDWSVAAFYDAGNAFNDWGDMDIHVGVGAGVRWYTIAGAIRVDVAQAQSIDGKPWQVHLTIGTPLL